MVERAAPEREKAALSNSLFIGDYYTIYAD